MKHAPVGGGNKVNLTVTVDVTNGDAAARKTLHISTAGRRVTSHESRVACSPADEAADVAVPEVVAVGAEGGDVVSGVGGGG